MKRWLKITLIAIGSLVAILFVAGLILHESRPEGTEGPEAEQLAQKMMQSVNSVAWDTTEALSWNFSGRNQHLWDKKRHFAKVIWGEYEVLVNINALKGVARKSGEIVEGDKGNKLVQKAWHRWANDSFWLNPIVKAFDPGTKRSIVKLDDGSDALMITYTSGGATPGDSYLWILDENGRPTHWKMWVSIIPVGGLKTSWENWQTLSTGAEVAGLHEGLLTLPLTDIKGGRLSDLAPGGDPFAELE